MPAPYHWFTQYEQFKADKRNGFRKANAEWNGPIKQAYLYENAEPLVLDITNAEDKYKIAGMPTAGMYGVATQGSSGTWTVQHDAVGRTGNVYVKGQFPDLGGAILAARASLDAMREEEARIAASPALQLERELKSRDWNSHMSDDHAHWSAGEAQDRRLKALIPLVPPDEVKRLWAQYAPGPDFTCPF